MRTTESIQTLSLPRTHLQLRQRFRLSMGVMAFLLVCLAGASAGLGWAAENHRQQVLEGRQQLEGIESLQKNWVELAGSIDQALITRQAALLDTQVNVRISEFTRRINSLPGQEIGLAPAIQTANLEISRELNTLIISLGDTTAEMTRAGREDRWVSYAWLRHTKLKPLEGQIEMLLGTLAHNLHLEIEHAEANPPTKFFTYYLFAALALTGILVAVGADQILNLSVYRPLKAITNRMEAVKQGDLSSYQPLSQRDEIGDLSQILAAMIEKMNTMVADLEQRVAERTHDLERRRDQMQVSSQVARDIATSQDQPSLLNHAVNLVRERFGFYHAGIFLLDQAGEFAVLRAATGEAGRDMLARRHRLKVGETGLVGYVTRRGEARIALDVGADITHFRNPLLPDTRSEMALPLKIGDTIIGALDVQSVDPAAFGPDDITVLQTLADQLAVAIENVRLVEKLKSSLSELESFYGHQRRQVWQQFTASRTLQGYRFDHSGIAPMLAGAADIASEEAVGSSINIPLEVRGATIGTLEVWPEEGLVSHAEHTLLTNIAGRISQAMESARLFEEAQSRAAREQVINQIATNISRSMDIDALLQTAVHELGQIPQVMEVSVHVGPSEMFAGELTKGTGES